MTGFWIITALMVAAALAFVAPRLIRGHSQGGRELGRMAKRAREQLRSLETAYQDGHVNEADYEKRKAEISGDLMDQLDGDQAPDPGSRSPATAIVLVFLAPLFALLIYHQIGDPVAIRASLEGWLDMETHANQTSAAPPDAGGATESSQAPDLNKAIAGLEERLAANPGDIDGWFLLGRSYMTVQAYDKARDAYGKAMELAPEEPVILVEYAEALAFASGRGQLPEEAQTLLHKALALDPSSKKALFMVGVSERQLGNTQAALDYWQRLLDQLEPGSEIRDSLVQQMNVARAELGLAGIEGAAASQGPPPSAGASGDDSEDVVAVTVEVSLDDTLAAHVQPSDTVFVFARAANGPPMPLAIQRLAVAQLPATVRLDETMSMMPAMNLAMFPEVIIGARVSKTGNATAQPGDLQAISDPISTATDAPIRLNIDTVL